MIELLLGNWKLVLIGLLMASTGLFYKLWQDKVDEHNIFKAGIVVLGQEAEKHAKKIEADNALVTKEIRDAIPKQITAARSAAVRRYIASLPVSPGGSGLSPASNGAGGLDAPGKEPVAACRPGFIEDAAQDAATIGLWQDWARGMGFPVK